MGREGVGGASTFRNYCYPSVLYCGMTVRLYDRYMLFAKPEKLLKPVKELLFSPFFLAFFLFFFSFFSNSLCDK